MNNIIDHFKNAMRDAGIETPEAIIADGFLHRFKIDGKLSGAYTLHIDGRAAGYFQDFKQDIKIRWKIAGQHRSLTDAESQAFKDQHIKQEVERLTELSAKYETAAKKASYIWIRAVSITEQSEHPYLVKKRIQAHIAKRYGDALVIPICNKNQQLVNLQFIGADGQKRFLSGGQKTGCFSVIGRLSDDGKPKLIAEGFATAATLHEALGYSVIVALDCGNLVSVAEVIAAIIPGATIIICADHDKNGIGEQKARAAAMAVNGKYIIPPALGDFNDCLAGSV